jgi:hypothetical protein
MDAMAMGCENADWILMAKGRDQWHALMDITMNLLLLEKTRNFLIK